VKESEAARRKVIEYKQQLDQQIEEQRKMRQLERETYLSSIDPSGKVQRVQPKVGLGSNFIWDK
jgi:hypothetical protein